MKILTLGGATQDIFILYEDAETMHLHTKLGKQSYMLLKEGSKIEVTDIIYSTGGGANNTALSFRQLGFDVGIIVKIAQDQQGEFILKTLKKEGVVTDHIIISHQGQTGLSFIIPSLAHDRSIFAYRGVNATLSEREIPFDVIKNYNYLYVTSLSGESSHLLLPIVTTAKKSNIPVATNPGTSQLIAGAPGLRESLPFIDILITNSAEAKTFMLSLVQTSDQVKSNIKKQVSKPSQQQQPSLLNQPISIENILFSLNTYFQSVLEHGPKIVVVTNGAEGVYVATQDAIYFHPALPIKVINTLGAGDAFGSSFVGSLAAGKSVEQAIRHGIINSASVIGFMNTKQGLLSMQELEKRAQQLDQKLLQKFAL